MQKTEIKKVNSFFSPQRFYKLLKLYLIEYKSTILSLIASAILLYIIAISMTSEHDQSSFEILTFTYYFYSVTLFLLGIFFYNKIFGVFSNTASSILYLMHPASAFEKWLCIFLILTVIWPAILFILSIILYIINILISLNITLNNIKEIYEILHHNEIYTWLYEYTLWYYILVQAWLCTLACIFYKKVNLKITLATITAMIFILPKFISSYFENDSIDKTILITIAIPALLWAAVYYGIKERDLK